ncbi:MAG: ROK family protein [Deltaproteobacteria bacterium]|nr:ROK family protein [Deltaproteobacteria bacterium]MBW2446992.1 ROK family protein [Deltaproteobacteria bacterium]
MEILGVDIGGSGVKGAPVELDAGELAGERMRIATPEPSTPENVLAAVAKIVDHFSWDGPIGCGFPGVVRGGRVLTAANLDRSWLGTDLRDALATATACPATVLNDADAAGLAEIRYGAGRGRRGVVLMLTFGTGIGSALFIDGRLVPNTEFGHLEVRGKTAEARASDRVREERELTWKKWAERIDELLVRLNLHLWPDLVILGGGVSKKHDRFIPLLTTPIEIVPAELRNQAGIVGAALAARDLSEL